MTGVRVHDAGEAVLRFWLVETPEDKRFARDPALDATIAEQFGALREAVVTTQAAGWRRSPRTLLAAIVLLDQFGRNLHRESAEAFAADPLARALTREALAKGWQTGMDATERQFLFMPLMHSEALADQLASLALFGPDDRWADAHARQIARFGRFPQRNAALGRTSTAEERAFVANPDNHF